MLNEIGKVILIVWVIAITIAVGILSSAGRTFTDRICAIESRLKYEHPRDYLLCPEDRAK